MKNTILLLLLLAFMSCQNKDDSYFFHGEMVFVDDIEKIDSLTGEWIELRGIYYGQMNVVDSLMIFTSTKQEKFISIFSVNTGNLVGTFCSKGGGLGEYISIADDGQLETSEGADIRLLLNAVNNNQLLWFNVSSSVARHQTCVDTTIPFGFIYSDGQVPFSFSFLLEEGIMAKRQETLDPPCKPTEYILYSVKDKEKLQTYPLYKDVITAKRKNFNSEFSHFSTDRIKPDRTKIAMAMWWLDQINILDIASGELKGYRIKDGQDFNDVNTPSKTIKLCNNILTVDNEYIYVIHLAVRVIDSICENTSIISG